MAEAIECLLQSSQLRIMRFDNQNTFIAAMRSGLNLFVGAGFSILAKDAMGKNLPLGNDLLHELHLNVGGGLNNLSKYCSLMERKNKKNYMII